MMTFLEKYIELRKKRIPEPDDTYERKLINESIRALKKSEAKYVYVFKWEHAKEISNATDAKIRKLEKNLYELERRYK